MSKLSDWARTASDIDIDIANNSALNKALNAAYRQLEELGRGNGWLRPYIEITMETGRDLEARKASEASVQKVIDATLALLAQCGSPEIKEGGRYIVPFDQVNSLHDSLAALIGAAKVHAGMFPDGKVLPVATWQPECVGYCKVGAGCVCGGDTLIVRRGCINWVEPT